MKKQLFFLALIASLFACGKSDSEIPENQIQKGKIQTDIDVNGTKRDYIIYIPQSYTGKEKYPLLFAFHGLGGNMESSYNNSKFHLLAEKENFIVVHPNGISSNWNAVTINNNIDVTFTKALIEKLENTYTIDSNRIYSVGMSNGGYFSFLLACELSDKIAAVASVTGLMFNKVLTECEPTRPLSIMQIHGTEDELVDYSGVSNVITKWISHNNTDTTPIESDIPNIDVNDGSTVKRFVYSNGNNGTEVQHLKITGGKHKWPGYEGNMDINASEEVWNFVKRYDLNGKIE